VDQPELLTRRQRLTIAVLSAIVALTRFAALSKGPWDWDEVLFCLAIGDYDVAQHRPHPPGFPLHIFLGRLARLVTHSDFTALHAVNLVAGFAVFPVLFWLAWTLRFRFAGSLWVATVFAFLPNVWFYGGTAFSDVPAMVLFLAAAAAYLSSEANGRRYVLASGLAAAAILYRPHNTIMVLFPWGLASWRLLRLRKWRAIAAGTVVAFLIVTIGYGIAIAATGFERYVNVTKGHAANVGATDSIGSPSRPPLAKAVAMLLDPYEAGKVSLFLNALALLGIVLGRREAVGKILLMFAPLFLFTLVATNPLGASRMSLGYMAGVVLLAAEGAFAPGRWRPRLRLPVAALLLLILVGRFVTWVLPAFAIPRSTNPPHVEAMLWLRAHVPPRAPIVFDHSVQPWALYYMADRQLVPFEDAMATPAGRNLGEAWFVSAGSSDSEDAVNFRRPRNRTWNIVTQRGFEALAAPLATIVQFGEGWHGYEDDGTIHWRWAAHRSSMSLAPMNGRCEIVLSLFVPHEVMDRQVELKFSFNGRSVQTLLVTKPENTVRLLVEPNADAPNVLEVESNRSFVPSRRGNSNDSRELAWMLRSWRYRQVGHSRR
jgi:hypothetical protein